MSLASDLETLSKRARQAGGEDRGGRRIDVVRDSMEAHSPLCHVQLQPGRPGVAVARLSDAAGIDQPAAVVDVKQRPVARLGPVRVSPPRPTFGAGEEERDVRMADQRDPLRGGVEARFGLVDREHVLPDRVSRGGVEESEAFVLERRPEAGEETGGLLAHLLAGPLDGRLGRLREGGDVDLVQHREVVVADQADVAAFADKCRAGVGIGAVADQVAEAPNLVDPGLLDRRENALEGGKIGVDIADDGYAQAASVPWAGRGPYD